MSAIKSRSRESKFFDFNKSDINAISDFYPKFLWQGINYFLRRQQIPDAAISYMFGQLLLAISFKAKMSTIVGKGGCSPRE